MVSSFLKVAPFGERGVVIQIDGAAARRVILDPAVQADDLALRTARRV